GYWKESEATHLFGLEAILEAPFFSFNPHAIPVRKKPVSLRDRMLVGAENVLPPGECRNQHQQSGLRQMEIRQQSPNHAELKSRIDKDARLARAGIDSSARRLPHGVLERTHRCRSHGNNPALILSRQVDLGSHAL